MNQAMAPPEQLEAAATLIERVIKQLNTKATRCERCSAPHYEDMDQMRAYERLHAIPEKLRQAAVRLRRNAARSGEKER